MPRTQDIPAVTDAEALAADAKAIEAEMQASESRQEGLRENLKAEKEHWNTLLCRLRGLVSEENPLFEE